MFGIFYEKDEKVNYGITKKEDLSTINIGTPRIKTYKPPKIETQVVQASIKETDFRENLSTPFLFIVFPFFAPRKKRNINIIYAYDDVGIEFFSQIKGNNPLENLNNQQPSEFERNIFEYILYLFQDIAKKINNDLKDKVYENLAKENLDLYTKEGKIRKRQILLELLKKYPLETERVEVKIENIIEWLQINFNSKYYTRIEEALYNLQATTYTFKIKNKRKSRGIIREEIYTAPINLITYEKRKYIENKKKIEYVIYLNRKILEELVTKSYSIFDKENLKLIRSKDQASEKIYQYLSMKRYNNEYEFGIETISTIAGFSLWHNTKTKNGEPTVVKKYSETLKKIKRAYENLVNLKYLESFEIIEDDSKKTCQIKHIFNDSLDEKCHIADFVLDKGKSNNIKTIELEDENNGPEKKFEKYIFKIKKNIYISKSYNKRVENLLKKIYNEEEEVLFQLLIDKLYYGLNSEIKKTLYSYINTVYKNIELAEIEEIKKEKEKSYIKEEPKEEKVIKNEEINIEIDLNKYSQTVIDFLYEESKALYMKDSNITELISIHIKIYESLKENYFKRVLSKFEDSQEQYMKFNDKFKKILKEHAISNYNAKHGYTHEEFEKIFIYKTIGG